MVVSLLLDILYVGSWGSYHALHYYSRFYTINQTPPSALIPVPENYSEIQRKKIFNSTF